MTHMPLELTLRFAQVLADRETLTIVWPLPGLLPLAGSATLPDQRLGPADAQVYTFQVVH